MSSITEAEAIYLCNAHADWYDLDSPGSPGYMVCYDGTPPANAEAALHSITQNDPIVTIVFETTAFGDAAAGGPGAQALIAGTPSGASQKIDSAITFARLYRGNGQVGLQEDSVSVTGGAGKLQFSTLTSTALGQPFTLNTYYLQQPKVIPA